MISGWPPKLVVMASRRRIVARIRQEYDAFLFLGQTLWNTRWVVLIMLIGSGLVWMGAIWLFHHHLYVLLALFGAYSLMGHLLGRRQHNSP